MVATLTLTSTTSILYRYKRIEFVRKKTIYRCGGLNASLPAPMARALYQSSATLSFCHCNSCLYMACISFLLKCNDCQLGLTLTVHALKNLCAPVTRALRYLQLSKIFRRETRPITFFAQPLLRLFWEVYKQKNEEPARPNAVSVG